MKLTITLFTTFALLAGCVSTPPLAKPSGEQQVGYQRLTVNAIPQHSADRWVDVQVFYPAMANDEPQLQATPDDIAQVLAKAYGMPAFLMRDKRLLEVYINAEAAPGRFPILVFNHGHSSYARQNQENLIELASRGYIVLALNHPGYSMLSRNGEQAVYQEQSAQPYQKDELMALLAQQAEDFNALRASQTLTQWQATMLAVEQRSFATVMNEFDAWVANNELVLASLSHMANGDIEIKAGKAMDLDRIGYFGHSFGGALATHMNMQSVAVDASLSLDGPVFNRSLNLSDNGQYCFAYGDEGQTNQPGSDFSYINQPVARAMNGCEYVFNGAGHMNFTDLNQLSMLRRFGVLGSVDTELMRQNLNQLLVSYFDQHLRNQGEISKLRGYEFIQH